LGKLKKLENLRRQEQELLRALAKLANPGDGDLILNGVQRTDGICSESSDAVGTAKRPRMERPFITSLSPVRGESSAIPIPPPENVVRDVAPSGTSLNVLHSTPKKVAATSPKPVARSRTDPSATIVNVKLQWPSGTRERQLPNDLQSVGKMLVLEPISRLLMLLGKILNFVNNFIF
jgi:hypothetical protein